MFFFWLCTGHGWEEKQYDNINFAREERAKYIKVGAICECIELRPVRDRNNT